MPSGKGTRIGSVLPVGSSAAGPKIVTRDSGFEMCSMANLKLQISADNQIVSILDSPEEQTVASI
jgi:hypothetical protein